MSNSNNIIEIANLFVSYEKYGSKTLAINGLSLTVKRGDMVYIAGANGSGKSTLLKAIAHLLLPDTGEIRVNGVKIDRHPSKIFYKTIYYINQNPLSGTIPSLTVYENLLATDPLKRNRLERKKAYNQLLETVHLKSHGDHLVHHLSGGQRQILSLIIAQLRNPDILLLDEPFAALDADNRTIGENVILKMQQSGKTILLVTHDPIYIKNPVPKIITLNQGQIL